MSNYTITINPFSLKFKDEGNIQISKGRIPLLFSLNYGKNQQFPVTIKPYDTFPIYRAALISKGLEESFEVDMENYFTLADPKSGTFFYRSIPLAGIAKPWSKDTIWLYEGPWNEAEQALRDKYLNIFKEQFVNND